MPTFIHPFDDLTVATGQGTIAMEIFKELPLVDYILVPIGGDVYKRQEVQNSILQCIAFKEEKINEKIKEQISLEDKAAENN